MKKCPVEKLRDLVFEDTNFIMSRLGLKDFDELFNFRVKIGIRSHVQRVTKEIHMHHHFNFNDDSGFFTKLKVFSEKSFLMALGLSNFDGKYGVIPYGHSEREF